VPAKSKAQRRFFAMCEHGKIPKSKCPKMSKKKMREWSKTSEKGLTKRVKRRQRKRRRKKRGRKY